MTKSTNKVSTDAENGEQGLEQISQLKECFIITPIGANGSDIYIKTEGLINTVLRPVLEPFGFKPMPAHHIDSTGSINKQIIENIVNCELVIANLTFVNPNVMYELAIRHSFGKRVITLAEYGTALPFDISDQRTLFYHDTLHGAEILKADLTKAIKKCLDDTDEINNISNPVYDAVEQVAAIQGVPAEQQDALKLILNRLNKLESNSLSRTEYDLKNGKKISKQDFSYRRYYLSFMKSNLDESTINRITFELDMKGLAIKNIGLVEKRYNILLEGPFDSELMDKLVSDVMGEFAVEWSLTI